MALIAVTGASGHVGSSLIRQLLDEGHQVRAMVRTQKPPASLQGLDVELVRGDVCEPSTLAPLLDGVDRLFHLAALISIVGPMDGKVRAVNVHGARNVAQAALDAKVKKMVHVSSVHAFAMNGSGGSIDETHPRANESNSPAYDASKASGEVEVRKIVDKGLDAVVVHPSGVLGPFDYGPSRMGKVLLQIGNGRMPGLIGGGFDWVDVRDVCTSMRAAADKGRTGESYILSGRYATVADLAQTASAITGARVPKLVVPVGVADVFAPLAEAAAKLLRAEPLYTSESLMALKSNAYFKHDKAREELGHDPRPLGDTLRDAYAWFAAQGDLRSPRSNIAPEQYGPVATA